MKKSKPRKGTAGPRRDQHPVLEKPATLMMSRGEARLEKASCLYGQISSSFYSAVPSKLYEYISSGRPVVFGLADGPAKNLVSEFENISVCTPDSPGELREKLLELKRDKSDRTSANSINQNIIQQRHLRENEAKTLVQLMKYLMNSQSAPT